MPSQSKSQSARTNGAKSHGPSTEAGRARSSQNALKHGFFAQTLTGAIQHEEERAADRDDEPLTAAEALKEAFRALANSPYLTSLHRTESRLERSYSRALRNLLQLQRLRQSPADADETPPPENQICKNEPNRTPEPLGFHQERICERDDAPADSGMLPTGHAAYTPEDSGTSRIRIGDHDVWPGGVQRSAPVYHDTTQNASPSPRTETHPTLSSPV